MNKEEKAIAADLAFRYPLVFTAKYLFKCLDILFKCIGWFLLLIALRVLLSQIESSLFKIFVYATNFFYFSSLTLFAIVLIISYRSEIGLPEDRLGMVLATIVKLVGVLLLVVFSDPRFPIDTIIDRLVILRISK